MAFLRNRAINLLNLHYAIHSLALTGGGAFFAVYLLKTGVPLPMALASLGLIYLGRFLIRPLVVVIAPSWGLRWLVVLGTVLSALQYPLLAQVDGAGLALVAFLVVAAAGETVYWSTYHAYFAALGDDAHRGHHLGLREAASALAGILGPLLTGWLLVAHGPAAAFGANAAVTLVAVLPLFLAPDIAVARHVPGVLKQAWPGVRLFLADGFIAGGYIFVWQVGLFLSLGEDFLAYGGALAMAAVAGAVAGLVMGRQIDAGHGAKAVWLACGIFAGVIALRIAVVDHATLAVIANALGALVACLYMPTMMTAVYTLAKRTPCTLRFHVATEGGWDMGAALGLGAAALLAQMGVSLRAGIALALIGVVGVFVMLRRYYAANPSLPIEAPAAPVSQPSSAQV